MDYQKKNFKREQLLTADDLNSMDLQIYENYEKGKTLDKGLIEAQAKIIEITKSVNDLIKNKLDKENVVQTSGDSTEKVMSQKAVTEGLKNLSDNKLDKTGIVHTTGAAEDKVMSQKAVTEELEKKFDKSNVVQSTGNAEDKAMSQAAATKEFGKLSKDIVVSQTLKFANAVSIPKNANFDDYIEDGNFRVADSETAQTIANCPSNKAGRLTVKSIYIAGRKSQEYETSREIYKRFYDGSVWGVWEKIAFASDFDAATIYRRLLTSADDIDALLENGRYAWVSEDRPKNCPFERTGGVVMVYAGGNPNIPTIQTVQVAIPSNENGYYFRVGSSSGMGEWKNAMHNPLNHLETGRKSNFVITEFEWLPYWYRTTGDFDNKENHFHSNKIPVTEGKTYYLGWKLDDQVYSGAFFDRVGNWIAPLLPSDITSVEYKYPDGTGHYPSGKITYADIYKFTAPAGACFFSWNLRSAEDVIYKQYIATMPVFALSNSGNYAWDDDYPVYQATKEKKLCIIGASTVMIDRLFRKVQTDPEKWEHIVGFQEYLAPWYKGMESYGFSSGSWRRNDSAENLSIYNGIVTAGVDLSEYDEFLLRHSNSGFSLDKIGDITTTDTDTYIGGLKGVIDYIYSQSPLAKIYVSGVSYDDEYYTDNNRKNLVDTAVEEIRKLCAIKGCAYIDPTDVNKHSGNIELLTYDGKHNNQAGSKMQGLFYRKIMVGI